MARRASRTPPGLWIATLIAVAPVSPLLRSPRREGAVILARNISTALGVCRLEAVQQTLVSPATEDLSEITKNDVGAEV